MTTTIPVRTDRRVRPTRAGAVLGTIAANLAVWAVAVPALGVDLSVRTGRGTATVGPISVAVVTMLAGLIGWALLGVLDGRTRRPAVVWASIACAVLLVSLFGPFGATTGAGVATLMSMHLVAGAGLIPTLAGTARRRSTKEEVR